MVVHPPPPIKMGLEHGGVRIRGCAFQNAATSCQDVRISRRDPLRDLLGVRALVQNGFLLIADITGYTMFQRASKIARERLVAEDIAAPVA
ncbi:hypothetical protein KMZ93_24910 [Bradyrhizobium sediminis]|uniref:Uncharacterized protein n=1 Tax=Bradyrhizobium sediminis TaxID=2840469 RepID=A0A975NXC4_9BRAD|nr:hypothetical protein [Bradyrhizobium sediminis]QWG23147.1 hypothetical protein KMZ93_24910 [Bradyrhizobium sediminis]